MNFHEEFPLEIDGKLRERNDMEWLFVYGWVSNGFTSFHAQIHVSLLEITIEKYWQWFGAHRAHPWIYQYAHIFLIAGKIGDEVWDPKMRTMRDCNIWDLKLLLFVAYALCFGSFPHRHFVEGLKVEVTMFSSGIEHGRSCGGGSSGSRRNSTDEDPLDLRLLSLDQYTQLSLLQIC